MQLLPTSRHPFRFAIFRVQFVVMLICYLDAGMGHCQGVTSSGTDFWCGFMPNFIGGRTITQLFLASGTTNTVGVSVGNSTMTYQLAANSCITVDLAGLGVTRTPESPSFNAVHVTSTAPLSVYGYNVWDGGAGFLGGSPDGYLAIPTPALGTNYYTINYYDALFTGNRTFGEFVVVSTQDSTTVQITTKAHTRDARDSVTHNPGDTWSFMMMKGQSYLVQSTGKYVGIDDLTGSHITSDKPIAVISGHQISPITTSMNSSDHLCEMVPPVDKWGTQYFDMPMAGRTKCGDYIRIISGENGNRITSTGRDTVVLNAGEWAEIQEQTEPIVFTSANQKKFLVAMYSYSQGFDGDPGSADPFLILLTPQEQFEKRMLFRTPLPAQGGTFKNYLTVIARADSIRDVLINGTPITSFGLAGEDTFPGTNPLMAALRVTVPNGSNSYLATADTRFAMYQYGFSDYEGYGWPTGLASDVKSADSMPPLASVSGSCGFYRVHLADNRHQPNFGFEDSRIADIGLIRENNDPRWRKPSHNYTFILDPNYHSGDPTANFSLDVINPDSDAYAAVYTVDRAGNEAVYQYWFTASPYSALYLDPPPPYVFGAVALGADSCKTVKITNASQAAVPIMSLAIAQLAEHGLFTLIAPAADTVLEPGSSLNLTICYSPADTGGSKVSIDSLTLRIGDCSSASYGLSGSGAMPLAVGAPARIQRDPVFCSFPNPTPGVTTMRFELSSPARVSAKVFDVAGRLWLTLEPRLLGKGNQSLQIDMSDVPNGAYVVTLSVGENSYEDRLTVLH